MSLQRVRHPGAAPGCVPADSQFTQLIHDFHATLLFFPSTYQRTGARTRVRAITFRHINCAFNTNAEPPSSENNCGELKQETCALHLPPPPCSSPMHHLTLEQVPQQHLSRAPLSPEPRAVVKPPPEKEKKIKTDDLFLRRQRSGGRAPPNQLS